MTLTSFDRVDGYGLIDIEGSELSVGLIRSARKVLERTSADLARHATYALAVHGRLGSGGVAALNLDSSAPADADPEDTLADFAAELASWSTLHRFHAYGTTGLEETAVGSFVQRPEGVSQDELLDASALASAGDLTGAHVVVASGDEHDRLAPLLRGAGASRVDVVADVAAAVGTGCEVCFVRGPTGILDHEVLAGANSRRIVGLQPLTTTARGLAFASRNESIIVPDFVSAAGGCLGAIGLDVDAIAESTRSLVTELEPAGTHMFVDACEKAEAFMRTWTEKLPFGRPLAP